MTDPADILKRIPPIGMPTENEMRAVALRNLSLAQDIFIENWPPALLTLSVPTEIVRLRKRDVELLRELWAVTWGDDPTISKREMASWRAGLEAQIAVRIDKLGGRVFVRLGSRSPKDNPAKMRDDLSIEPVCSAGEALDTLTGSMERIMCDLTDALYGDYEPTICLRKYLDIKPEREFRTFVEKGEIAGISQYFCRGAKFDWIQNNAAQIDLKVRDYLTQKVIPAAGMESFTADIILSDDFEPTLLEVNPAVSIGLTDPCLFADGELNGRFKFLS